MISNIDLLAVFVNFQQLLHCGFLPGQLYIIPGTWPREADSPRGQGVRECRRRTGCTAPGCDSTCKRTAQPEIYRSMTNLKVV